MRLHQLKEHAKSALLAAMICIGMAWLTDRESPQDYREAYALSGGYWPSGRRVAPATPGGNLVIHYEFSRDRSCPLVVQGSILDAEHQLVIAKEEPYTPASHLGDVSMNRPLKIDPNVNPGPAIAKVDIKFYCNPVHWLWPIQVTLNVPFTVVEHP